MLVVPLTLSQANGLVARWHRHHKPVVGHRFSLGALVDADLVGAVIVGRSVDRRTDQYRVAEVTRLVTDGTKNACSFLYGAAARVAREMGFDAIQTFILDDEPGISLRASGWEMVGLREGRQWIKTDLRQLRLGQTHGNREDQPTNDKQKWLKRFRVEAPPDAR